MLEEAWVLADDRKIRCVTHNIANKGDSMLQLKPFITLLSLENYFISQFAVSDL